ncbi:MAG: glycosyltransferase [Bacteroidia bacterium]
MKILLITTNYAGGAGICARRLHQALLVYGFDSNLLVLDKIETPSEKKVYSIEEILTQKHGAPYFKALRFFNRLFNKLPTIFNLKAYINGPYSLFRIDKLDIYKDADIIHLHWVPKIISYKYIFADKKKIFFWTLHDMNPFTGGNHYTVDLDYSPYEKMLQKNIKYKKKNIAGANLTVVALSQWLGKLAKESAVFKDFEVKVINSCIDTNKYKPIDKKLARKKLGLNSNDKKYILFVAEKPGDVRKGMHLFISALNKVKNKSKMCVLVLGKELEGMDVDFEVKQLGFKNKTEDLVNCYSAADFFVIPSIEDNLPNTIVESLACGTPVVGFNIGGIPDMVKNNVSGLLSELYDEDAFVKNIEYFIDLDNYDAYSKNGRATIEDVFSEKNVVEQITNLYKKKLFS